MRARNLAIFVTMAVLFCVLVSTPFVMAARKSMRLDGDVHGVDFSKSVPNDLNYQGYLVDATDTSAVTAVLAMTFRIYDAETMGSELWSETHPGVPVVNGLFNVLLGSVTPFPGGLFDGSPLWLQTEVGAEILAPRKPLVSVAYSHRAEMADHAVYADQADTLFLGSPTQDGALHMYRDGSADPTIRLYDHYDAGGGIELYEESGYNHTFFEPDINGSGGFLYVGRNGSDAAFMVDGNASGTEEPLVTIGGSGQAAYFQMGQTGDASVMLPDNAISAPEIMDEPGVSNSLGPDFFYLDAGNTNYTVDSVDIDIPDAGFVEVTGGCYLNLFHTVGTKTEIWVAIDKTAGNVDWGLPGAQIISVPSLTATSTWQFPCAQTRMYEETSAGVKRYYLNARYDEGTHATTNVARSYIRATYYPTIYGTVTLAETKGFSDALAASQTPGDGTQPAPETSRRSITVDQHNARLEAEMAAMRAELEALKREVQNQNQ
jgi:hypothetical protein